MDNPFALLDDPSQLTTPRPLQWLARSKIMAVIWTTMRVWLGAVWIQAGAAKLWGAENPAFLHHNGAGVAGFATHGVAAYTWWGSFLHSFVVPNAAPIGVFIAVAEFAIGIALVLGLLTPLASLASLVLLFTYVMSGTASVCAFYALFAIIILATWRTSSWLGVDGFVGGYVQRRRARRLHGNDGTGHKPGRGLSSGGVMTCCRRSCLGPSDSLDGTCKFGPRRK